MQRDGWMLMHHPPPAPGCVGQNEIGLVRFFVRTKKRTIGRNYSFERSRPETNEGPGGGTLTLLTTELT